MLDTRVSMAVSPRCVPSAGQASNPFRGAGNSEESALPRIRCTGGDMGEAKVGGLNRSSQRCWHPGIIGNQRRTDC